MRFIVTSYFPNKTNALTSEFEELHNMLRNLVLELSIKLCSRDRNSMWVS